MSKLGYAVNDAPLDSLTTHIDIASSSTRTTELLPDIQVEEIPLQILRRSATALGDHRSLQVFSMKFSSALKFNAVADWWDEYIAYDVLKRRIYQLEKEQHRMTRSSYTDLEANEHTSLVDRPDVSVLDSTFIPLLDQELKKVTLFYEEKEKELFEELAELEELVAEQDAAGLAAGEHYLHDYADEDDDDDDEDDQIGDHVHFDEGQVPKRRRRKSSSVSMGYGPRSTSGAARDASRHRWSFSSTEGPVGDMDTRAQSRGSLSSRPRADSPSQSPIRRARSLASRLIGVRDSVTSTGSETVWTAKTNYAWDIRLLFKRRITNLYLSFSSLKSYVEVNYSGFRKILKKYDKVTYNELKDRYMHEIVEDAIPFLQSSKDKLNSAVSQLVSLYAKCVTGDDSSAALQQLKSHQREHIAWERDTVWRQMLAQERRGAVDSAGTSGGTILVQEEEIGILDISTPLGGFKLTRKKIALIVAVTVFIALMNTDVIEGTEANKCFAILVFSTIMWASEAIPLFVTSTLVPLLLVVFRVIQSDDGTPMTTSNATKYIFSVMFSPTIMLLIGGLTISSALSKTNIDRMLITRVLSLAGTKPPTVLLSFMGVSCFASMWISNVAAPALCFTLIRPILRTLPPGASFAPCLILAIALAANIGGQSSPISSPQNLIALGAMEPQLDWGSWFAVSLPVSIISILVIWLLLLASYRPSRSPDGEGEIEIRAIRPIKEPFTLKQYWVTFVCLTTIALWCIEHQIESFIGDMGIIAIIPIVAFFATGVLKKDDFEQFAWTIVFLAMGGVALGQGVTTSGLMNTMDGAIHRILEGKSLYTIVMLLSPVVLVISTFISHTIASVLLVPIAKEVGKNLPGNRANLLIFITGLICSTGMGMPVSGFPNQLAAAQEDDLGQLYLTNIDFLKNGVPASVIATLVVATVGFVLMTVIG
ncbi:SPX domain-containing protein [Melanogaster broomeanus]|nr:SPX domain-containing protein [Melanogaster broomeanus]